MPRRTTHQGLCPWTPLGTSVPQTPCAPTSNPGYATDAAKCQPDPFVSFDRTPTCDKLTQTRAGARQYRASIASRGKNRWVRWQYVFRLSARMCVRACVHKYVRAPSVDFYFFLIFVLIARNKSEKARVWRTTPGVASRHLTGA